MPSTELPSQGDEADASTGGVTRDVLDVALRETFTLNRQDPVGTLAELIRTAKNGGTDIDE